MSYRLRKRAPARGSLLVSGFSSVLIGVECGSKPSRTKTPQTDTRYREAAAQLQILSTALCEVQSSQSATSLKNFHGGTGWSYAAETQAASASASP